MFELLAVHVPRDDLIVRLESLVRRLDHPQRFLRATPTTTSTTTFRLFQCLSPAFFTTCPCAFAAFHRLFTVFLFMFSLPFSVGSRTRIIRTLPYGLGPTRTKEMNNPVCLCLHVTSLVGRAKCHADLDRLLEVTPDRHYLPDGLGDKRHGFKTQEKSVFA